MTIGSTMALPAGEGLPRLASADTKAAKLEELRFMPFVCAGLPGLVLLLAFLDLVGWIFHVRVLTSVFPGYATMKPNTAISLGLLAVTAMLRWREGLLRGRWQGRGADGLASLAFVLGVGSLAEYAFRLSLGLDGFFLSVPGDRIGDPAGRMSIGTALCVALIGAALVWMDRAPRWSVGLLLTAGGVALSARIGFVFGAGPLFGVPWLTSLAVHTATGLLLVVVAALAARPQREPVRSLLRQAFREGRTRWLLAGVTLLPLALSVPLVLLLRAGLTDAGFSLALLVVLLTGIQTLILWRDSVALEQVEARRIMTEQALLQSEKLAVVGRLAASIAHEVNNPLEAVGTLVYLIQEADTLEEAAGYARTAQSELLRVTQITSQTLNYYRKGKDASSCETGEILESALKLLGGKIVASGVSVLQEVGEPLERVECRDGELRQVFINLISNALDATPRGGRLRVRARRARRWVSGGSVEGEAGVRVVFGDTGTGMTRAVQAQIFEPFFTTKMENGNGLGLWVAQELIEKHGGALRVWSSTRPGGSGTVFSVFLPLGKDVQD
jgi:signal transduction histidine kinase